MSLTLQQNAELNRLKSEIASQYGVENFEDIDRGDLTSRANGDITRTLVELAENNMAEK
ncbi:MAG: small, acid-soluble spore protein, alpha/beta type [Anaerovoracaceae bacterium]